MANIDTYVLMRLVPGQAAQYSVVSGISIMPPPVPGVTVGYSVRTTAQGSAWSTEQSITYASAPKPTDPQAAPVLSVSGQTLTWNALAKVSTYILMSEVPGRATQYSEVSGTSITPPPVPGATVRYSIRTAVEGSAWAPAVAISYPSAPSPGPPPLSPPLRSVEPGVIIGVNASVGYSPAGSAVAIAAGIKSTRLEMGRDSIAEAKSDGYSLASSTAIVGNTADNTALSSVNLSSWTASTVKQVEECIAGGIALVEVGNEVYEKGKEPARYAEMFMALHNALISKGIRSKVKLLFNSYGAVSDGKAPETWLGKALAAQPGLKTAVDAFSMHPYGRKGENSENRYGPGALIAEHTEAVALGFANTDYYLTEFGIQQGGHGNQGAATIANSEAEEAEWAKALYAEWIGLGWVKGIWWFGLYDHGSEGNWGLLKGESGTNAREVLSVIGSFSK